MSDLISRQAAIEALRDYLVGKNVPCDGTLTCRLIENEVINKLPTAEPKRGKWIEDKYGITICSECRKPRRDNRIDHIGWCNACGAKMGVTE